MANIPNCPISLYLPSIIQARPLVPVKHYRYFIQVHFKPWTSWFSIALKKAATNVSPFSVFHILSIISSSPSIRYFFLQYDVGHQKRTPRLFLFASSILLHKTSKCLLHRPPRHCTTVTTS